MKFPKEKLYSIIRTIIVILIAASIGFFVYKAGSSKPLASVTATFVSADTANITTDGITGKQFYISFNYLLKNNTDQDYTITSSDKLKKFENISNPTSLLEDDSDIVVNLPIFIPAHQSVLVYFTDQNFPYTSPYQSSDNRTEINNDVADSLNTNDRNLNGFTFIDTVNNLTIVFPNGWKNIAISSPSNTQTQTATVSSESLSKYGATFTPNSINKTGYLIPLRTVQIGSKSIISTDGKIKFSELSDYNSGQSINEKVSNDFGYVYPDTTTGEFLEVNFTATNLTNEESRIKISKLKLIDQEGREYTPSNLVMNNLAFGINLYSPPSTLDLKPGIPSQISLLFEVANDVQNYHIDLDY